eukprot:scaffold635_cov311-Pinguiococcus_pyrenoidosus.AAC.14
MRAELLLRMFELVLQLVNVCLRIPAKAPDGIVLFKRFFSYTSGEQRAARPVTLLNVAVAEDCAIPTWNLERAAIGLHPLTEKHDAGYGSEDGALTNDAGVENLEVDTRISGELGVGDARHLRRGMDVHLLQEG